DVENDELTFVWSAPADVWLHVAGGTPGSHVVVVNPERANVPRPIIERAAELAAWYSKARASARVEVHVCRVADVRKERGAPKGQVRLRRYDRVKVVPRAATATPDSSGDAAEPDAPIPPLGRPRTGSGRGPKRH